MMNKMKLFGKSAVYSFCLIKRSSQWMILLYFVLNIIGATLPLFSVFLLKYLLDLLTESSVNTASVMFCVGLYIASLVLLQGIDAGKIAVYNSVFKKAEHLYECDLSEKLAALPISVIDTSAGKDMVDDVRNTQNTAVYLTYRLVRILTLLYSFCVAYITLIRFDIKFSILFLVLTVPGIILDFVFSEKSEQLRLRSAPDVRRFCYYRWMLTDAWPAKDVRMYDLTNPIKARYDTEKDTYRKANKKLDQKKTAAILLAEIIMRSGEIAFTVFVIKEALSGRLTVGDVALYIGLAISAAISFQNMLSMIVVGYQETTESMERFFKFMDINCQGEKNNNRNLNEFESLEFKEVYFKYPMTEKYVLQGVSFKLNKGEKLSIVGINGSGKSTIIKLMLGLYQVEAGEIFVNGYPMSEYDNRDIRKLFSVLFQNFAQYPISLRDNISLSDHERSTKDSEITDALRQSGIWKSLEPMLNNGLDSYMTRQFDDKGIELSKGQWQKIALARAYFKKAPVVIFDEPSAALDAEAEDEIFKNFKSISGGKTGIMISHRISAARMSDKIIVLNDGKISESGTHDELAALGGLYAKLYNLQKEKYTIKEV